MGTEVKRKRTLTGYTLWLAIGRFTTARYRKRGVCEEGCVLGAYVFGVLGDR